VQEVVDVSISERHHMRMAISVHGWSWNHHQFTRAELEKPAVIGAINTGSKHRRTCPRLELVLVDNGERSSEPYDGTDSHHTTRQIKYLCY
jgi:hypothetical protein